MPHTQEPSGISVTGQEEPIAEGLVLQEVERILGPRRITDSMADYLSWLDRHPGGWKKRPFPENLGPSQDSR